jgi:hypothetical protein
LGANGGGKVRCEAETDREQCRSSALNDLQELRRLEKLVEQLTLVTLQTARRKWSTNMIIGRAVMSLQAKLNGFKADLEAGVPIDKNWHEQDGAFVREFRARVGGRWAPTILAGLAGRRMAVLAEVLAISALATTANAYEAGFPEYEQKPGFFLGVTAEPLAPGWYGADRVGTFQAQLVGPGAPVNPIIGTNNTSLKVDSFSQTVLWASGWNVLGGAYEAAAILPLVSSNIGAPVNADRTGIHNSLFVNQLAWKLSDSGFFFKTSLLTWAPTGSQAGPSGLLYQRPETVTH